MAAAVNDATSVLLRALKAALDPAAGFTVESLRSRAWSSVTFAGARHELTFRLEGERAEREADRFLCGLEAAEFGLSGHILADISVVAQEREPGRVSISVEALTVEE